MPTHADIARVLEPNAGRWETTAIVVMLATWLRRGELLGLCWRDLDLVNGALRVERNIQVVYRNIGIRPPKSEAGKRTISLPPSLIDLLKTHRQAQREDYRRRGIRPDDDIIFATQHGGLQHPNTFSWAIAQAGDRAGVHLHPHLLRHRFATDMLLGQIDVRICPIAGQTRE